MKSTGGNLEPMPFVRKWGAAVDGENGAEGPQLSTEQCDDNDAARVIASSGKHRNRSHSKSSSSKKHKKRSSRSPEKKKHKKRSRSRESKHRKRDRSRESKRTKDRDEPNHQQQQNISAFPPPSDYLQQVQQRHQQEMQHQQKPTPIPLMQLQFKQETDYGGMEQQQSYGQLYQQDFQQPQQNARQSILLPQQSQLELEQQEPEKKNDALSAALAAAAMVAQKLGKGGFTPGGGGGGSVGALGPSADLLNRIPQTPQRATPISETVLAKEQVKNEPVQTLTEEQRQREQRRKSRWSTTKAFVPGMPTILPSDIDENQRQVYLFQMEIEETTRRLRQSDFGQNVDPAERSPSPEPVYDTTGKRLNTREVRKRQEIEQRRHEKIQALLRLNPNYKPPADYRPPNIKLHDKVWIPQEEHPEINFVGLLIGPRGNTLKALEAETGAKIIIRGKGSIKEGKLANRTGPLPGENEPLHAYVTSTDREAIKRGCDKIREIINAALMIPDGQNELRKLQLRELALLNGTLRPEDVLSGARCTNCGSDQHKTWECMEAPNVTANVICTACGGAGHIARDCKNPRPGFDGAMMDAEYSALMAELGEKPPISLEAGTAPPLVGGKPIPGFPGSGPRPRFALPAPTPIVRVNLAKQQNPHHQQPIGGGGGYPGWDGSNFYGFSGLPGQDPAAAAAAWAAWQAGQSGFPAPVPPPPGGGFGPGGVDSSLTAGTSAGGLAMFPPPPPPPPPAPKHEIKEEFDSILSAPAPPPPPT